MVNNIIEHYKNGEGCVKISKIFGYGKNKILQVLKENNIVHFFQKNF